MIHCGSVTPLKNKKAAQANARVAFLFLSGAAGHAEPVLPIARKTEPLLFFA